MPKIYTAYATATIYYQIKTIAETEEEARENIASNQYSQWDAIDAGKRGIIADMEYQDSEEYIAEMMEINDYEFDENGRRA